MKLIKTGAILLGTGLIALQTSTILAPKTRKNSAEREVTVVAEKITYSSCMQGTAQSIINKNLSLANSILQQSAREHGTTVREMTIEDVDMRAINVTAEATCDKYKTVDERKKEKKEEQLRVAEEDKKSKERIKLEKEQEAKDKATFDAEHPDYAELNKKMDEQNKEMDKMDKSWEKESREVEPVRPDPFANLKLKKWEHPPQSQDDGDTRSLEETKQYFQGKWKANIAQTNSLQYVLQVSGKSGIVRKVSPQGEAATTYLQQTKLIKLGQRLISPAAAGNSDKNIRVLLQPDGNVDTFTEP